MQQDDVAQRKEIRAVPLFFCLRMKIWKFTSRTSFSSNVYVVESEKNFLVDPGYASEEIFSRIRKIGGLDFILLTHGHFDHILGVDDFVRTFNCPVYASREEIHLIERPNANGSKMFLNRLFVPQCRIEVLDEGEQNLSGVAFDAIEVPGHTRGSLCYFFKREGLLFVGDLVFADSIGRSDLPGGSEREIADSLDRLRSMPFPDSTKVCPGHGPVLSFGELKKRNPFFK